MYDTNNLVPGTPVDKIIPNYLNLLSDLEGQRKKYEEQELEATTGPEPTKNSRAPGENEMYQIKKMSRSPFGKMIVENLNKGIEVLSITDTETGDEDDLYSNFWVADDMDSRLEIFKQDYTAGGWGFWEMAVESGRFSIKVKSPKKVTVFSSDPVNSKWADMAVEKFTNAGVEYFRYFDAEYILTFQKVDGVEVPYVLVTAERHPMQVCPIVAVPKNMTSDGVVTGALEYLKPNLDTIRQRTNMIGQASYWTGTKTLIIEGLDMNEVRFDKVTGQEYNPAEEFINQVRYGDGGMTLIPPGINGGPNPTLSQTEEGNLIQLVETKKDAINDIAALTGLPAHIFGGDAPSTGEATIQSFLTTNDNKDKDKKKIGRILEMMISQLVYVTTGERRHYSIVWSVSEQVSINSLADTMAKMVAAGVPLVWVVRNVLKGYRPDQISDLLQILEKRDALTAEQSAMLLGGLGGM